MEKSNARNYQVNMEIHGHISNYTILSILSQNKCFYIDIWVVGLLSENTHSSSKHSMCPGAQVGHPSSWLKNKISIHWALQLLKSHLLITVFGDLSYIYIHIIIYIYIYINMSNQQNYCNTNFVLLCLGLSEVTQNLHNR